ncbi:ATP-binding protein [Muricomes sp. OA1]|uniref:ATP-binding protein n=1 Tax=Hungatella hathewayi TaxID=154046 RepID=A0A3E2X3K9_9FIRM|nr:MULTISPECIES: ATP-binding protein [Clostridia]MCH1971742.1 ATP-binding protein [Muricomes sp. OA1]RGC35479.1 ATP-binding protein [Hungatella hathewayi]GKH35015.1 ATPase [Faecalicatena contorta]
MVYIKRAVEGTIEQISTMFPVLLVTGPRQVGKTTLLQKLAETQRELGVDRKYVTLDDPDVRYLAKKDPALFMQRYTPPVLIDEIQYATELLPYIKMSVDRSKRKGDFWITGSQVFRLMQNVSESLAGRVGIVNLLGLSDAEIYQVPNEPFSTDTGRLLERLSVTKARGLNEIYRRIFRGSMPELYADDHIDWETYYRSYVDTYLQRDIRDLAQVADEMQFYNFMTIAAAHTSKPVVYEELASAAGITAPTAKKWLSVLVSSHIIALVQPYHNNALKRVVKMPLLHFLDTGLAAYLLKWGNPEALERGAMSGAFFESYVFSEIYKSYLNAGKEPPIYYYRDKDQKEIDLLIFQNGILSPIEIKKAASPGKTAIKNFHVLDPVSASGTFDALETLKVEIGTGSVVCMANELLPVDEKNWYVPVWLI